MHMSDSFFPVCEPGHMFLVGATITQDRCVVSLHILLSETLLIEAGAC